MNGLLAYLSENARWLSAGILITCLSSFGQTFFIALFAAEIQNEFSLSHGDWGLMYSVGTTASAIAMVWAGQAADLFRVRTLGALSLGGLALACLAMAGNSALWALPVIIFALRLMGQGMMSHIAAVAMARWFVATRGRALSISALGFSVGQAFFPIIVVALLTYFEWRMIWILCAAIALIGIPLLMLLLSKERTPASMAEKTKSFGMQLKHWTRGDVLRHPLFWLMVPALLGPSAFNTAFFFHQVHFAEIKGISNMQLVAHFPLYTVISIVVMIVTGALLDKFGTPRLIVLHQVPMIFAFVSLSVAANTSGLTIGFVFLAITAGATATLMPAFWAEFYGTAHLGAIKAMATAIMVLGSAIGPGLTGSLIDLGFGLEYQFFWIAGYFAFATLTMLSGVWMTRKDMPVRA